MTAPVIFNAFDFFINSRLHRLQRKNTQLAPLPFPKVWFATWNNEKMFFRLNQLPWSKSFLLLWVIRLIFPLTILAIKRSIVSRWLPKYLKRWRLFVDFFILYRPWPTTWPPGFKRKLNVNLQSTFLLQNFLWINLETRNTQDDDTKAPKRNLHLHLKSFFSML